MTIDAVQKALLKLGGDQCTVSVSMHRLAGQDDSHRYESESWSGFVSVKTESDEPIRASITDARSGELLIKQLRAHLRNAIHEHTFRRRQRAIESPRRAIGATLRLEHQP